MIPLLTFLRQNKSKNRSRIDYSPPRHHARRIQLTRMNFSWKIRSLSRVNHYMREHFIPSSIFSESRIARYRQIRRSKEEITGYKMAGPMMSAVLTRPKCEHPFQI